jgi:endonuclease YncB( thermonuclease family)
MSSMRRIPRRQTAGDPFVRSLGGALWCVPLATTLALAVPSVINARPYHGEPGSIVVTVPKPAGKPIMTRAIVRARPGRPVSAVAASRPRAAREAGGAALSMVFAPMTRLPLMAQPTGSLSGPRPATNTAPSTGGSWHMQTFYDVSVADGLHLRSGNVTVALAGVEPLAPDALCRRIDGVEESCAVRATNRLELLVRGRAVVCRVYDAPHGSQVAGACRADKIDLVDDLVRNGLARRGAA